MTMTLGVMADSYNKPASGGWTPASLGAALQYWFDASDLATITDAGAGAVSAWNDKSGNARHVTMVTAGYRPLTGTRTINGKNVIDFDGVNDALTGTAVDIPQPMTIAAVAHIDSLTSVGARIVGRGASQFNFGASGTVGSPPFNLQVSGGSGANVPGLWETTKAHVAVGLFNTTSTKARFDGVEYTPTGTVGTGGLGSNPFCLGSRGDGSVCWDGAIGEVVVTNTILTGTDLTNLESYLTAKWIAPAGFSPLSIPWHSAFWASDPGWIPPADGGAVADWKNSGTSAANATQATGTSQPTYRTAYANLNGKPAVEFDGTSDNLASASASIPQPNQIVVVGWLDPSASATPTICDAASGTARHILRNNGTAGTVLMNAGTGVTTAGAGRNGAFVLAALYNGASSALRTNGTAYTVASTVGAVAYANVQLGRDQSSNYYKGAIAFLGVSDTELTAQQITDLETWAKNYYGVPVAAWTPTDLGTKLKLWYDASDAASITSSAGDVSQWNDKSGNAKHMVQATAAKKPKTGINTINGMNVLTFDGVDDMMTATPAYTAAGVLTTIMVCSSTEGGLWGGSAYRGMRWQTANLQIYATGSITYTAPGTAPIIVSTRIDTAGGTNASYIAVDSTKVQGTITGYNAAGLSLGFFYGTDYGNIQVGEVLELNDATLADEDQARTYLKEKWGTP